MRTATTPAAPDTTPPTAPTGLTATAAGTQPDQPELDGLDRQRRRHRVSGRALPGRGLHQLRPGRDATGNAAFSNTGLAARHQLHATACARSMPPATSAAYSNTASGHDAVGTRHRRRRRRRRGLTRQRAARSQINLSWTASTDNVGGHRVSGRAVPGRGLHNFAQIGDTGRHRPSATPAWPPTPATRYRVRAGRRGRQLQRLLEHCVRHHARQPTRRRRRRRPGWPRSAAGNRQVNLSWTASTDNVGVTGYRVERCQGNNCSNFVEVGTSATTAFSSTGLSANTRYRFRVRASDAAGNLGPYSNIAAERLPR